jgi:hypothetical protein
MRHQLFALVVVAGCAPATFAFTPASREGVTALPENCPVEVVTSVPAEKNYEELGTLEFYSGSEPKTLDAFKMAVKNQVCDAGGNAAIAIPDAKGQYTQGTIIKYLPGTAKPIQPGKPTKVVPAQAHDTEKPPGT